MFDSMKSKKSTTKKRKLDTSRLVPVIAIVEALVLIAVSTFAWYFMFANKSLSSGVITVNADSGLEIDFKDADKTSYINIFDYIDEDNFFFEPASSVDGRNIYFPTSGTFNNTNTTDMVFRDGTVNDINSKYINIDFTLTNTYSEDVEVYLSNNSFFRISNNSGNATNGKALRMALYNNDGNSGDVTSHIVSNINKKAMSQQATEAATESADTYTVYFTKPSGWDPPKIYFWHENGDNDDPITDWPGYSMAKVVGDLYSYSFTNNKNNTPDYYNKVVFYGGSNSKKTADLNLTNNKWYTSNGNTSNLPEMVTVYFLKPSSNGWNGTPMCAVGTGANTSTNVLTGDLKVGGESMTEVTTGIYSYTFPSTYNYVQFLSSSSANDKSKVTSSANLDAGKLYYFPDSTFNGGDGYISTVPYSTSSIYFYNTLDWAKPYAHVNAMPNTDYGYDIPMISLSGGLYYAPLCTAYLQDVVAGMTNIRILGGTTDETVQSGEHYVSELASNCKVYFHDNDSATDRTETYDCKGEHVFRALSTKGSNNYYQTSDEDYVDALDVTGESYAVISPGVSAGFQRGANPVNAIVNSTGAVTSIVPTFASSFDDYIMGSGNPVFTIKRNQTVNMSMIIWLEGTDEHCTAANYAGKNINLYLEFSTKLVQENPDETYTYRFIDATREVWTGDTITSGSVKIDPVMQLYDATNDRGYLMKAKSYTTYNGEKKTQVWECTAPAALMTDREKKHHLEFRRVNPYNESQVWNYWDAGYGVDYLSDARSGNAISFTAFADGSPDRKYFGDTIGSHTLPEYSCGGLWGAFNSTETLHIYDGRKVKIKIRDEDIWVDKNTKEKPKFEGMALTFGYTYTYPNSRKSVTIEYKASPSDTDFYDVVIPTSAISRASNSYFVLYKTIGPYALNAEENDKITLGLKWNAGNIGGLFYEFDEEYDFDTNSDKAEQHSYWGSDVVYIQIRNSVADTYSSNDGFNQIHFYKKGTNIGMYSYLYETEGYGDNNIKRQFVAVVPSGAEYDTFDIQRTNRTYHTDNYLYRYTGEFGLAEVNDSRSNGVRWNKISDDNKRLITIDWDKATFYYKNRWNNSNYDAPAAVHIWAGDFGPVDWNMTSYYDVYRMTVQSNRDVNFKFNDGEEKWSIDYHVYDLNGKQLGPDDWSDGKIVMQIVQNDGFGGNVTDTETGHSTYSTTWLQYAAKETH